MTDTDKDKYIQSLTDTITSLHNTIEGLSVQLNKRNSFHHAEIASLHEELKLINKYNSWVSDTTKDCFDFYNSSSCYRSKQVLEIILDYKFDNIKHEGTKVILYDEKNLAVGVELTTITRIKHARNDRAIFLALCEDIDNLTLIDKLEILNLVCFGSNAVSNKNLEEMVLNFKNKMFEKGLHLTQIFPITFKEVQKLKAIEMQKAFEEEA